MKDNKSNIEAKIYIFTFAIILGIIYWLVERGIKGKWWAWLILVCIIIISLTIFLIFVFNKNKFKSFISIEDIDLMSGIEFENFVSKLFSKFGYETEVTKASGDQGIDVLAKKNGSVVAIQAKCYSRVVGNHSVMEAVAGMNYYEADKCIVVTNSTFTKSAIELAKANNVELWDRKILKEKIGYIEI